MIWRCRKPGSERSVQSPGASKPEPESTCTRFGLDQEHLTGKESHGGQDCLNDLRTNLSLLAWVEDRSQHDDGGYLCYRPYSERAIWVILQMGYLILIQSRKRHISQIALPGNATY